VWGYFHHIPSSFVSPSYEKRTVSLDYGGQAGTSFAHPQSPTSPLGTERRCPSERPRAELPEAANFSQHAHKGLADHGPKHNP
jgi:hypothetical protein